MRHRAAVQAGKEVDRPSLIIIHLCSVSAREREWMEAAAAAANNEYKCVTKLSQKHVNMHAAFLLMYFCVCVYELK